MPHKTKTVLPQAAIVAHESLQETEGPTSSPIVIMNALEAEREATMRRNEEELQRRGNRHRPRLPRDLRQPFSPDTWKGAMG